MQVFEEIRRAADRSPTATALIEDERRLDYGELLHAATDLADELRSLGVDRERPVGLVCEDSIEYVVVSLALLSIGTAIVPIPPRSRDELVRALDEIDPRFVVYDDDPGIGAGTPLRTAGARPLHLFERDTRDAPPDEYAAANAAFIRFSSGTTSTAKGVVLSHARILERIEAANAGLEIGPTDRVLWVLSMSFHFVVTILLFLRNGATILLAGRDFPDSLSRAMRHGPTVAYASPFHYRLLSRSDQFASDSLSRLRLAVSTAMPLPPNDAADFRAKFGFSLAQAYGIIEVGLPFLNASSSPRHADTVGQALPGYEIRVFDPDEQGVGEIQVRGPGMFVAYYSPWTNADELMPDGWFATGDLGRTDDEGYLQILGRRKNVINFAGMKIFPEEVEAVLNRCPGVRESYVYAQSHDEYGELPCADVVLEAAESTDARRIRRFCYRNLAWYKTPKSVRLVDRLTKTPSGKIRRWGPDRPD